MDTNSNIYELETSSYDEDIGQVTESQSIPAYADVQTYPCTNCGRRFNNESLRKHQPICKKTSRQSRKVFDTGKQRATDSDVPYQATRETTQFYQEGIKPKSNTPKAKTSNWREGHNALVRTIRQARQITQAIDDGVPLPKHVPSQVPSDYIQCEYCQRHFNKYTAERHIPFCETQYKRKQMNYLTMNNIRTPPENLSRQRYVNQPEHQINSASSKLVLKRPQKINNEKDYQRPPINPNGFKPTTINEPRKNPSSKYNNQRIIKTRNATGNYLRNITGPGRTPDNNRFNTMEDTDQEQQTYSTGSRQQQRMTHVKTKTPGPNLRPTHVNGGLQQQKIKIPPAAKHCHECGEAFPVETAKFCCSCGEKRYGIA
ncbi:unnamed protein product [Adineta steineri]|uniref:C2HC/C3H-type domain-containing protein n=1 Tax=Adineta steineri TaxID=433720 RepID=A0A818GRB0_9BILA|nr:unnamed protein product [Adineta steineri]CAF3493244.1 unnamed protein product [Adineta steineri]